MSTSHTRLWFLLLVAVFVAVFLPDLHAQPKPAQPQILWPPTTEPKFVMVNPDGGLIYFKLGAGLVYNKTTLTIDVKPTLTAEEKWCPGPVMAVAVDRMSTTVGQSWSVNSPCFVHFNLVPPVPVDPISVSVFTTPFTITIPAGSVVDDDVYLYALAPTFTPQTANAKIGIRIGKTGSVTCDGCTAGVNLDNRIPRMFPASSVPIGMIPIRSGKFSSMVDDIISRKQVFIGPGAEMQIVPDQGGYWFNLKPASTQLALLAQRQADLQAATTSATLKQIYATPMPLQKVAQLERKMATLEGNQTALQSRVPATLSDTQVMWRSFEESREMMAGQLQSMTQEAMMATEQVRNMGLEGLNKANERTVPLTPQTVCDGPMDWAMDTTHLYRCVVTTSLPGQPTPFPPGGIYWLRFPYDRKWK